MSLKDNLMADMKSAMKAKDSIRLDSIRLIRAAIQRREVDDQQSLNDDQTLDVINKLVKQCKDSISQFNAGDRPDLAEKEQANLDIFIQYLPEQLSESAVDTLIAEAIDASGASEMKDMGKVMGIIKQRADGQVDMALVSKKIRSRLG